MFLCIDIPAVFTLSWLLHSELSPVRKWHYLLTDRPTLIALPFWHSRLGTVT